MGNCMSYHNAASQSIPKFSGLNGQIFTVPKDSMDQDVRSSLAGLFWLRISHEVEEKVSVGVAVL